MGIGTGTGTTGSDPSIPNDTVSPIDGSDRERGGTNGRSRVSQQGPSLTALATLVVLGPVARFADAKHVVSYVGLAPSLNASADKYRLGHITKQGSSLLQWVLGQAAPHTARLDVELLVRLFIMLRDHGLSNVAVGSTRDPRVQGPPINTW